MKPTSMPLLLLAFGLPAFVANGAVVAEWNLGEADPGASAGNTGNSTTIDSVGSFDRTLVGDPTYSATVPLGGSSLSMAFDGSGDYYTGAAPTTDLTQDFSYSFDANFTALGPGFSFLASLGSNFGGISVVEIGGNVSIFFPGLGTGTGSYAPTLSQWARYDVNYSYNGGSPVTTLSVDGSVVSTRNGSPVNNQIVDYFTIGGNAKSATAGSVDPADFEGSFNGLIDNVSFSVVPEPSTMTLAGLGLLAAFRRRRG